MPAPTHAPRRSSARELLVHIACVLAVLTGAVYLVWRLTASLNTHALWFSLPLWGAEAFGFVAAILFFFSVWNPWRREAPPAPRPGQTVDIFVPTYNEPLWIVRRTLMGAVSVAYPHETYLLDDGRRPEMERLAEEVGAHYLTRPDNAHAKAGNLNHALQHSSGDFVAIFDADHVAMPEFLDRTLGYFDDPKVAFVQTPHEFYNIDSYQHRTDKRSRTLWHEQALFFRLIQPGKDRWNAAFFCGSCAVIRRSALEEVGGIATETVTEDLHTSIRLHARGWRSVYQREVLAYGISPQSPLPYHVQRLRWGQGAMQVLRRENPLLVRGLSLPQRLSYLSSNLHYFEGFEKLAYFLAPPIFLVTGILPIHAEALPFLSRFAAYYLTLFAAFKLSSRGYGMSLLNEGYKMTRYYTYLKTTLGLFARKSLSFKVTMKEGQERVPIVAAAPYLTILALSLTGLAVGSFRALSSGQADLGFWVNAGWAAWHALVSVWATRLALRSSDVRRVHRSNLGLPARWSTAGRSGVGVLADLHEGGGGLLVRDWPADAGEVEVELLWPDSPVQRTGRVQWVRQGQDATRVGLEWTCVEGAEAGAAALFGITFGQRKLIRDLDRPADRLGLLEINRNKRRQRRVPVSIPALLLGEKEPVWGLVEDWSDGGALLLMPVRLPPKSRVQVALWGDTSRVVRGSVAWASTLDLPPHIAHRHGAIRKPVLDSYHPTVEPAGAATADLEAAWARAALSGAAPHEHAGAGSYAG
ncbi:MAG: glycosyltransferase [Actinomycetota bacterium]